MRTIKINVYREGTIWYGARWIDGEYDGCDALEATTEREAVEEAQATTLGVDGERIVVRVADVTRSEVRSRRGEARGQR